MSAAPGQALAEVQAAVRDRRLALLDELGVESTLWLAAPPLWTRAVAEAAGFPVRDLTGFVRRASDVGWCKTDGPLLDDDPDLTFWMPDEVRREVIDLIRGRLGVRQLLRDVQRIADGMAHTNTGSLGALTMWSVLMRLPSVLPMPLVRMVQEAVTERRLSLAQDCVIAGEAMAAVVGGTADVALSRARRLLSLGLRRRQDERALGKYLDRPELSGAVSRLLAPATEQWALHLRGVGGVGKTMLIRYLASGRWATDRGHAPITVARVDFDHMRPDYPVRRPVQLLVELADELSLYAAAVDRADRALPDFQARATRAHEAVSGAREVGGSPLANEEVARAVDSFGVVLDQLAKEFGGVLLILDTCEELAKADMGNPAAPAVRATFEIIERLQQRAPSLRVLFAGRRPLPERDYLAVQPVAGFTVEEARRYLSMFAARPPDSRLADAMIRQSPAVELPRDLAAGEPRGERVSPFDLALYAAWADEDPELSVARVDAGSDAYIEGRIIERLDDPLVRRTLPVLATAGRCRVATIASLLECDPAALGQRLAAQEWVAATGDPSTHVMASPALARRLRRYFGADERRAAFDAETARLATALQTQMWDGPIADIDVDELIAALRLCPPGQAATLWDSIAERAMDPPGHWATVGTMTRRILGEWEEEEWPTTSALRATVTAAHIAASRRDSRTFDARPWWETVDAWAGEHPDPRARRVLATRADLGLLLGPRIAASSLDAPELAAAAADAMHRILDEKMDTGGGERLRRQLGAVWEGGSGARAWQLVAEARLMIDSDQDAGRSALVEAGRLAVAGPAWPDWIPPDDLLAPIWIEHGLITPPEDLSVLDEWEAYAADHLDTIDGERLASLCLRIRLRYRVLDASVAEWWEALDGYVPDRVSTRSAHDLVPPLFISIAEAWLSAGEPERALAILNRRTHEALATREDEATIRHADAEKIRIIRRLRLKEELPFLHRFGDRTDPLTLQPDLEYGAWRALTVVHDRPGVAFKAIGIPARWHAWWQSQGQATETAWDSGSPAEYVADIKVDIAEMRQMRHPNVDRIERDLDLRNWLAQPAPSTPARSAEPYRDMRAAMRMASLLGEDFTPRLGVPPRVLAEMAFEEAELTGLRLPEVARRLFALAADYYGQAGDEIGRLLALASISSDGLDGALGTLRERNSALAAKLTGPPEDAGPWRYWAEQVQGWPALQPAPGTEVSSRDREAPSVVLDAPVSRTPTQLASPSRPAPRRVRVGFLASFIAWFAVLAIAAALGEPAGHTFSTRAITAHVNSFNFMPLATVAVVGAVGLWFLWRIPQLRQLAAGRGIGTSRLGNLLVEVDISPALVRVRTRLRPMRTAPLRAWATLWLTKPAVGLIWGEHGDGYYGISRTGDSQLDWRTDAPCATSGWWHRGRASALGFIRADRSDRSPLFEPWERILSASLSPDAAGRIQWIRLITDGIRIQAEATDRSQARNVLIAASEWVFDLAENYDNFGFELSRGYVDMGDELREGERLATRHVIARAVATAVGPAMEAPGQLLDVGKLRLGRPRLVVLQAEPIDGTIGIESPDDQAEKLLLGAELAESGVSAVLLLPVLPVGVARQISKTITTHAKSRYSDDFQRLLTKVRKVIAPHVPPQVLDDVVLFLNERYYRK